MNGGLKSCTTYSAQVLSFGFELQTVSPYTAVQYSTSNRNKNAAWIERVANQRRPTVLRFVFLYRVSMCVSLYSTSVCIMCEASSRCGGLGIR